MALMKVFQRHAVSRTAHILAALLGVAILTALWPRIYASKIFDHYDLSNYFAYSAWADGAGRLYVEVYSDYLLLPNLLFGAFHFVAARWSPFPGLSGFDWLWLSSTWCLFVWTSWIISSELTTSHLLSWLAPSVLYFVLFRYEIYLVLTSFAFLFALRKGRYISAALWLGLVIALKGYGLFLLPCLLVYLFHQVGARRAAALTALALLPFVLEHLAVYLYAGSSGVAMPYRFQGNRPNSIESLYSAIAYLFGHERPDFPPRVAQCLQLATALVAATANPKTFERFCATSALAVLGFILFSPVTSPQFFLWFMPMLLMSGSAGLVKALNWLTWLSFLNYPIIQFLMGSTALKGKALTCLGRRIVIVSWLKTFLFKPIVIVLNALRAVLFLLLMRRACVRERLDIKPAELT